LEKTSMGKWPLQFPLRKKGLKYPKFPQLIKGQASRLKLDWGNTAWFIAALFIGRATLMGEITPFAFIFWVLVYRLYPEKRSLTTVAVLLGWAISVPGVFPPWFLPASMIIWLGLDFLVLKDPKKRIGLILLITYDNYFAPVTALVSGCISSL
jgi:hypothetical protein